MREVIVAATQMICTWDVEQNIKNEEKFYFHPGDTGFKVWNTTYAKIGIGICWDQWFPEVARSLVINGAEILLYPTAIGSEPHEPEVDSKDHWQIVQQGHSAANIVP